MEIVSKTILRQIITQCAGTQDIIKKLASCDPCGRKSGLKTVAFLLRLSIYTVSYGHIRVSHGLTRSHTVSHGLVRLPIRLYTDMAPVSVFLKF